MEMQLATLQSLSYVDRDFLTTRAAAHATMRGGGHIQSMQSHRGTDMPMTSQRQEAKADLRIRDVIKVTADVVE